MLKSFKDKFFGSDYEYYDESEYEEGYEENDETQKSQQYPPHLQPVQKTGTFLGGGNKVQSIASNDKMEILNFVLDDYALTGNVCKHIKAHKPIVVNMNQLDISQRQRALDYLTGATHALNGSITRVADNIFIFAPSHIDVNADKNLKHRQNWTNMEQNWSPEEE